MILFQLNGRCPHLIEVCRVAMVECHKVTPSYHGQVHRLMERIFSHYFPARRTCFHREGCVWFLQYANCQLSLAAKTDAGKLTKELSQNDWSGDLQMSKLYLSCMLGEQQVGGSPSSEQGPQDPLALYNSKVRLYVFYACM